MKNFARIWIGACAIFMLQGAAAENVDIANRSSQRSNESLVVAANGERDFNKELQRNRAERERIERDRREWEKKRKTEASKRRASGKNKRVCRRVVRGGEVVLKCTPRKKSARKPKRGD